MNRSSGFGGAAGCGVALPGPAALPASGSPRGGESPTHASRDVRGAVAASRFLRTGPPRWHPGSAGASLLRNQLRRCCVFG